MSPPERIFISPQVELLLLNNQVDTFKSYASFTIGLRFFYFFEQEHESTRV